jgi:hypothetical protein
VVAVVEQAVNCDAVCVVHYFTTRNSRGLPIA